MGPVSTGTLVVMVCILLTSGHSEAARVGGIFMASAQSAHELGIIGGLARACYYFTFTYEGEGEIIIANIYNINHHHSPS